jgi:HD-GYP domain-containing protein (c-di-GMP phosphodiesterase class II)
MGHKLLSKIHNLLDQVVFVCRKDGCFSAESVIPDWLIYHTGKHLVRGAYDLTESFPYLGCFIEEAREHWLKCEMNPLVSDIWIETDAAGREVAFQAQVMSVDEKQVLLLTRLGSSYQEQSEMLQHIRESMLTRELLEAELRTRTQQIRQREEDIALKLISLTSYRDEETGSHVRRIGLYAAKVAEALGWGFSEINDIRVAAPMHDIGKVAIPDNVLLKAGALNDEEFMAMKKHTLIGYKMLAGSGIPVLEMAATIARSHHERWDGTGYPDGLKGSQIPLAARITAVVDIYDALVHKRVYKAAMDETDALNLMRSMAGQHLDPEVFNVFLSLLPVMRSIRETIHEDEVTPVTG